MVSRREKMFRSYFRARDAVYNKQLQVVASCRNSLSSAELASIADAQHGASVYDFVYAHPTATLHRTPAEFESLVQSIRGSGKEPTDLNGMRKNTEINPYRWVCRKVAPKASTNISLPSPFSSNVLMSTISTKRRKARFHPFSKGAVLHRSTPLP